MAEKFSDIESMFADRSNLLQTALSESHDLQSNLEGLLQWLTEAEVTLDRLQNKTTISMRRDFLNDHYQQYKVWLLL